MSRSIFFLISDEIRANVKAAIDRLPHDSRIEIREPKRSIPQNDRMWAMLTDVSNQADHLGRKYAPDVWKALFMHELGQQCEFVPSLDGQTVIPLGYRSSELSVAEMTELITVIEAWGASHGVTFHEPKVDRQLAEAGAA
jgi:hypothetical protein